MAYAQFDERDAFMWTDFGEQLARRYFAAEVIDALPRGKRGAHAGKIKAIIHWRKCVSGGWVSTERGYGVGEPTLGHVERRVGKIVKLWITDAPFGGEPKVLAECEPNA